MTPQVPRVDQSAADPLATVVFAGDWHGNTRWAEAAIAHAATKLGASLLLHAGDYAFEFSHRYVRAVEDACALWDVTVWAVRGNHDDPDLIADLPLDEGGLHIVSPHVRMIPDGHVLTLPDTNVTVMGLGGAVSIDRFHREEGETWWPGEVLDPELVRSVTGPVDIVLAHDCPTGVPLQLDPSFGAYFEDRDPGVIAECNAHRDILAAAVDRVRPALLVHGHYHQAHRHDRPLPGNGSTRVVGLDCDGKQLEHNVARLADLWSDTAGA